MSKFHDEFFKQGSSEHDQLLIRCISKEGIKKITNAMGIGDDAVEKYETEVLMKNGTFVMGYADIILNLGYHGVRQEILVEVKPNIVSIGDIIRQIKTYASLRYSTLVKMVIATYSTLDDDAIAYLSHERISVVVFDRPNGKKPNSEKEESSLSRQA